MFITSIVQALLFALTVFSGAFFVPVIAGLLRLEVIRKRVIAAIIFGGIIALVGKTVHDFYHERAGNIIIIATYFISILLLFVPTSKGEKKKIYVK